MNENQLLREALQKTLETLKTYAAAYNECWRRGMDILEPEADAAIAVATSALSHPAQSEGGEVVTVTGKLGDLCSFHSTSVRKGDKLYTTPPASKPAEGGEAPLGAILNGREYARRLVESYGFSDLADHKLELCSDWIELLRCFEHLAEYAQYTSPPASQEQAVARFNWSNGGFEWLVPYSFDKHNMRPLYLEPEHAEIARKAAQEQLYTERERHTAEVKSLQAEIGRLKASHEQAQQPTTQAQELPTTVHTNIHAGSESINAITGTTVRAQELPDERAAFEAPKAFVEWLEREMPPDTVVSDPSWWAPRIYRAALAAKPVPDYVMARQAAQAENDQLKAEVIKLTSKLSNAMGTREPKCVSVASLGSSPPDCRCACSCAEAGTTPTGVQFFGRLIA